jgi:GNAT superfamily N-acetyltransferase
MGKLRFVQLQKGNEEHYALLEGLMLPYDRELDEHRPEPTMTDDQIKDKTRGILNMQGPSDRHLELCYSGNDLVGLLYGKVDHENHRGHVKPGFGYVMEFYVKPEYRRKGYGKEMFHRLEKLFAVDGAKRMYLNADPVTGVPFWTAMGFCPTDEIQPHNNMVIFERPIRDDV